MKKNKVMASYRLEEVTKERIKEMAKELENTEAGIIESLVNWYYKERIKVSSKDKNDSWQFMSIFEER